MDLNKLEKALGAFLILCVAGFINVSANNGEAQISQENFKQPNEGTNDAKTHDGSDGGGGQPTCNC